MSPVFEGNFLTPRGRFAVCVSRFNSLITEQLRAGAEDALLRHGVAAEDVDVFKVPGTFELPGLVRRVAESGRYVGVVALGCVIRGETWHFEIVAGVNDNGQIFGGHRVREADEQLRGSDSARKCDDFHQ